MTTEQIAKRVGGVELATIANKIRLLKLPKFVKDLLVEGVLTEGQVRPLAGVDEKILQKVIHVSQEHGVSQVEQFTVDLSKNSRTKEMPVSHQIKEQPYKKQLKSFKQYLKADVSKSPTTRGSGRITIKFKNEDEFERLQKLLSSN
jgi:ParB family chromosome partitioning protein